MKQNTKTEKTTGATTGAAPQTRRYEAAFKQAAVANWIKTGQSGTQIAHRPKPAGPTACAHGSEPDMGHGSDLCVDGGRLAVCGRAAGLVESARGGLGHGRNPARPTGDPGQPIAL